MRIGEQPIRVEIHSDIAGVRFEDCFARAEVCSVKGVDIRVIGLQDLRTNKSAADRAKDRADLDALPDE